MSDDLPYRKLVRHHDRPGVVRELTFSCYRRLPLLAEDEHKRLLGEAIDRAITRHAFQLIAFVFMPEHVHLLVFPLTGTADISSLLAAIKRPCSFRIKQQMIARDAPWLDRLTIRERPGKTAFRFWQEGGGYDRDVVSGGTLRQAVDYLHNNPVRRGLVERADQWPWSSWGHYHANGVASGGPGILWLPTVHGLPEMDLLS